MDRVPLLNPYPEAQFI